MSEGRDRYEKSFWRRQEKSPLFHNYCSLHPLEFLGSFIEVLKGEYNRPSGWRNPSQTEDDKALDVKFIPSRSSSPIAGRVWNLLYLLLAYSPLVVLSTAIALFASAEFSTGVNPLSVYLPNINRLTIVVWISAILIWGGVLLTAITSIINEGFYSPFSADFITDVQQLLKPVIVYGGGLALFGLTIFSVYLLVTGHRSNNVIFSSGYLFLLYIGGPLVFDGFRRTENLFSNLDVAGIVESQENHLQCTLQAFHPRVRQSDGPGEKPDYPVPYHEYLNHLQAALGSTWIFHIPKAMVASLLFVLLWVVIWWQTGGPFNLSWYPTLLTTTVVNWVIGIVAIQFIVLIKFLNDLYEGSFDAAKQLEIRYEPSHGDNAGGLRDLGRFITRVNTLLILAGLYLSYRLYVQGFRDPVMTSVSLTNPTIAGFVWVISYILPILTFVVILAGWVYFAFWTVHRKMVEKKFALLEDLRPESGDPIAYQRWQIYKSGPVWPINDRLILTMISLDVVSLILAIPALLS